MATTAEQMRAFKGVSILSAGFRPFYLFASVWSALMVPLWIWIYSGGDAAGMRINVSWHAHEMLFGYLGGIIAGFLLTAVPNWTGRLPVTGIPLAILFGLWGIGRVAMLCPARDSLAGVILDSAFLCVFAAVIWREILTGKNWRNLPIAVMVTLLALANIGFHLGETQMTIRLTLGIVLTLIALIGGRIIPSFTTNWLKKAGRVIMPPSFNRLDLLVIIVTAVALLGWAMVPVSMWSGGGLLAAGGLNGWRLSRWRGLATGKEPLLWILHVGYAWLVIGLVLLGMASLGQVVSPPGAVPMQAGLHALTAGAIGVMTLAVMTRSTLGHTGRPLTADRGTLIIYILVNAAAVVRVGAALMPQAYMSGLIISAALWMMAFAGFIRVYGPKLVTARLRA
ncbi:NnrS family protein [Asticcacaulis sp.]|uniref:NnrS family protein n=1 Tax=Asticcacaulis sp. TaxID=1872648 RepID=UPI002BDC5EF4|nr:NnrS family protein [Asticcacaulis sp.]HTM82854.1 NnrS family protein [Asticcacaulis sp.]